MSWQFGITGEGSAREIPPPAGKNAGVRDDAAGNAKELEWRAEV